MTRPSLAGIEQRAEVFRLHVPVSRCDTWEHGSSCPDLTAAILAALPKETDRA